MAYSRALNSEATKARPASFPTDVCAAKTPCRKENVSDRASTSTVRGPAPGASGLAPERRSSACGNKQLAEKGRTVPQVWGDAHGSLRTGQSHQSRQQMPLRPPRGQLSQVPLSVADTLWTETHRPASRPAAHAHAVCPASGRRRLDRRACPPYRVCT